MNDSRRRFFWLLCSYIALVGNSVHGQESPPSEKIPTWADEIAKNYLPYHQLTTEDFPVNDKAHPKMAYWFEPFVHYHYHCIASTAPGGMIYVHVTDWTVFSGFDKNLSSRNSKFHEMKQALPYIQAMFDLSELHARQLAALKAGDLPSAQGETFEKAQTQIEDRVAAFVQTRALESKVEADEFVKATDNGQNKGKVRKLAAQIKERLEKLPQPGPLPAQKSSATIH